MEEQEHLARTGEQLYDSEEDEVEVLEQAKVQNAPQQQTTHSAGWYDDDEPIPVPQAWVPQALIFGPDQGNDMYSSKNCTSNTTLHVIALVRVHFLHDLYCISNLSGQDGQ